MDYRFFWDSPNDPLFERRDQVENSDLGFLQDICRDYGIGIKVTDTQLVCYDEEMYENKDAILSLNFGDKRIKSYRFRTKTRGTYKGAKIQYHDPVKDETFEVYQEGDAEGTGQSISMNQKADNLADATTKAEKKLHDANKKEITASISLMGDLRFLGGSNISITGWGQFDGKYFIEKASHTVSKGSGDETSIDLRMGSSEKRNKKSTKKKQGKDKTQYGPLDTGFETYAEKGE